MKSSKQLSKTTWIVLMLTGMLFGWMLTLIVLSGTGNIDSFYDSGKIYDIDYSGRMQSAPGINYDMAKGHYQVSEDNVALSYILRQDFKKWNAIYLTIANLSQESMPVTIEYYLDGVLQKSCNAVLTEGKNYIDASGIRYNQATIRICNQNGLTFTINSMQFRQRERFLTLEKAMPIFAVSTVLFVILAGMIVKKVKATSFDWYMPVEALQEFWIYTVELFGRKCYTISNKTRSRVRVCFISLLFLLMAILENFVYLHSKPWYGMTMLLISAVFIMLSFISAERKLILVNWRNPLTASWMVLWIMAIVSDLLVDKKYQYQGYIMLFVIGFFFFVWSNMKNPMQMIADFVKSGEIIFWITTVFIFFCRPVNDKIRFSGFFRNPNIEAAFASAAFILFLVELDNAIAKKKINLAVVTYCVGIIIAFDRVYRSNGRTGQLAVMGAIFFFVIHFLRNAKRDSLWVSGIKVLVLCAVLFVPVMTASDWLLHNLAFKCGTQVVYPKDLNYMTADAALDGMITVYANEETTNIVSEETAVQNQFEGRRELDTLFEAGSFWNAIEAYSSGRTLYYLAYVRQMNLFGHYYYARNWGDYIYPHNGLLSIMFRYGIFAAVPYIMMMVYTFWYALVFATDRLSKRVYKLYPLLITIGMFCNIALENGEKPFVWMIWMLFYMGQGLLFVNENNRHISERGMSDEKR